MSEADIVERLRATGCKGQGGPTKCAAADEITRLRSLLRQIACQTDPEHARKIARQECGLSDTPMAQKGPDERGETA